MSPVKKHIEAGVEALLAEINKLDQNSPIYIFFYGSKNHHGESWCPDCVKAEPVVNDAAAKLKDNAVFIHCDVGLRDQWKTLSNPFRLHESFRLTAIPTLLKWNTSKRLVEAECLDKELMDKLFEGDMK